MDESQQPNSERRRGRRSRSRTRVDADLAVAFVDSSAIIALVDRKDATHSAAVAAYRSLVADGYRLFTTNHVVVETYSLLLAGLGPEIARQWLRESRLAIYYADAEDEEQARRMVIADTSGRNLTLTNAISIIIMERLGVADAFAIDPDFMAALA